MDTVKLTKSEFKRVVQETARAARAAQPKNKDAIWWQRAEEARTFKKENGHTNFPYQSPLYGWVDRSRAVWRKGNLPEEKIAVFKELGINRIPVKKALRNRYEGMKRQIEDEQRRKESDEIFSRARTEEANRSMQRAHKAWREHIYGG